MVELHSDDGTHPRPLLRGGGWGSLDGEWQFAIDEPGHYREPEQVDFESVIRVPFAPESPASGVGRDTLFRACWYRRQVTTSRWHR